jgi:rare lipoprotein A
MIVLCGMAGICPVMAETCIASVYGTRDHDQNGTKTASGIPLRNDVATIARPTRAHLGRHELVTNLANNRSQVFHVTDVGPFKRGRCVDLSHQAAREIGCPVRGLCRVTVQ